MATEKDITFIVYLRTLTKEGKLKWEATARADEFTASLKGKYNVLVRKGGRFIPYQDDPPDYALKLVDQNEQELILLTDRESDVVRELFELARRASLNVDAILDQILQDDDNIPL